MKIEGNAKSFFGFFVSKLKVSLVSSVIGVIKDFEFGEVIFFHYIIIKYILL